jgi:hypothetical protein
VEEIPDEERINVGPTLPEGAAELLMTEEEYCDTLKGGKPLPIPKVLKKTQAFQMNKIN